MSNDESLTTTALTRSAQAGGYLPSPHPSSFPLLDCFASFLGPGLLRLLFLCVTPLSCLGLALSLGSDQLFDMGPMSTSMFSSSRTSWTSESDEARETPGTMRSTQSITARRDASYFWSLNGGTAISATRHVAMMLVPTPRTLVWSTSVWKALWVLHGRQGPLRATLSAG